MYNVLYGWSKLKCLVFSHVVRREYNFCIILVLAEYNAKVKCRVALFVGKSLNSYNKRNGDAPGAVAVAHLHLFCCRGSNLHLFCCRGSN